MLNSSRDKNEGTYRGGDGGGGSPRYVTLDLSYTTTGREGESTARIINGMNKNNEKRSETNRPVNHHFAGSIRSQVWLEFHPRFTILHNNNIIFFQQLLVVPDCT